MSRARSSTLDAASIDRVRAALRQSSEGKAALSRAREELARLPESPERAELEQVLDAAQDAVSAFDERARRVVWQWGADS